MIVGIGGTSPTAQSLEFSMRKVFVLFAAAAALTTAACNTVAGVGRDTQAAGQAVTTAAEDAAD